MCVVRLLAKISTVAAGFCRTRTMVPYSIWHFRSKKQLRNFRCYVYHLDSLIRDILWMYNATSPFLSSLVMKELGVHFSELKISSQSHVSTTRIMILRTHTLHVALQVSELCLQGRFSLKTYHWRQIYSQPPTFDFLCNYQYTHRTVARIFRRGV